MSAETALEVGRLYGPIKQIADTLTAAQNDVFVRLPGLEVYWPCGIRDRFAKLIDHTGGGGELTQVGTCPSGYDGNAYVQLGDGVNYFSNGSIGYITGTETYIDSTIRGLTLGCWFWLDALPSVTSSMISKDGPAPQRGYSLWVNTSGEIGFVVSSNGTVGATADGAAIGTGGWVFLAGRFVPGAEVAVFINGVKSVNTTAVPASINVSTQALEVGRYRADDTRVVDGKVRDIFVCAAALSDELIAQIRANSMP